MRREKNTAPDNLSDCEIMIGGTFIITQFTKLSSKLSIHRQEVCKGMGFKEARLAAGLTVQQVVKALKVSDASVYLWETGQMYPKTARLHEIADLYGCTVDELLRSRKEEK